ncbi:MAG: 4Fe-4S dicluster domain-containing protein [Chloroflexi bacterium]|nr:4Fe-4S dicluster domain-containing protein [Chloroflexota bacterium]
MVTEPNKDSAQGQLQEQPMGELPWATSPDPELGKQVARDAQRVVAGELSEEEFYQRYHDAYLREFGVDDRPLNRRDGPRFISVDEAGKATVAKAPRPMTNEPLSRRAFLMLASGGAAALALSTTLGRLVPKVAYGRMVEDEGNPLAKAAGEQPEHGRRVQMGMVIDLERCTGCLVCVDACHRENNTEEGVHWIYVVPYKEEGQEDLNFLVRPCQHCTNPPCVKVCPVMARHKREKDGLVLTDQDKCIGTRYCQVACPYGVNYFQWGQPNPDTEMIRQHGRKDYRGRTVEFNPPRGVMGKCTFCPQRQDSEGKRGTTSCQQACPHDAIHFGDMNDPNSEPRRYLERRRQEKGGHLSTFRLLDELGTEPNILYIGPQPSRRAKQVDGPITYEDWGWVDRRGTVLEGPRPWFMRVFGG